jgi:hypothetical protein
LYNAGIDRGRCIVSHSWLSWLDTIIALQHRQSTGFGSQGYSVRSVRSRSHPRRTCRPGARRPRQGVTRLCHMAPNELDARLRHASDALDEAVRVRMSSESVPRAGSRLGRLRRCDPQLVPSSPAAGIHTPASSSQPLLPQRHHASHPQARLRSQLAPHKPSTCAGIRR